MKMIVTETLTVLLRAKRLVHTIIWRPRLTEQFTDQIRRLGRVVIFHSQFPLDLAKSNLSE
jgi:hypothetical protein